MKDKEIYGSSPSVNLVGFEMARDKKVYLSGCDEFC